MTPAAENLPKRARKKIWIFLGVESTEAQSRATDRHREAPTRLDSNTPKNGHFFAGGSVHRPFSSESVYRPFHKPPLRTSRRARRHRGRDRLRAKGAVDWPPAENGLFLACWNQGALVLRGVCLWLVIVLRSTRPPKKSRIFVSGAFGQVFCRRWRHT